VRAYPTGGGAYRVARENLAMYAGLTAGSALLIDYVMTVSVSIVAGVDAIVSAAPALSEARVALAILFVLVVALLNLRGARESATLFAIPTYGFVLSIGIPAGDWFRQVHRGLSRGRELRPGPARNVGPDAVPDPARLSGGDDRPHGR
jgi:hypothetical protein